MYYLDAVLSEKSFQTAFTVKELTLEQKHK